MTSIADFTSPTAAGTWQIVNDGVMGGVSRSELRIGEGWATFAGTVSPDNNGGFASMRARLDAVETAHARAIAIRVRGDGKRYQLRVRTSERWDGVAYKHGFTAAPGQWSELELPVAGFQPTFRGRAVPGAPALDPARIRQIGVLIADKQFGPFQLEVEWIRAIR